MAIFDFLFGSSNPPPVTTTTQTNIPSYIAEPTADIIGEAMDVAKEGYIPYTGPRLAGLTPTELAAMQQAQGMAGIGALQAGQAYTAATAAGAPALSSVPSYMTDYQKQVADIAAKEMEEKSLQQQQQIAAQAVGAGGLDSSRFAILEAERQKALTEGLGNLYATAQADAYKTALAASQKDREQQLKSAGGMGQLAATGQQLGQADIAQQLGIGALEREQQQKALDITYSDFLKEQQYPKEQLGFVSNIIRGAQFPTQQVTTSPGQTSAPIGQQLLGFGLQGLGAAAGLGWQPFK
jgi:hypothetical protein